MGLEKQARGRRSTPGSATTAASAPSSARASAEPGETMMSLRRWLTVALRLHRASRACSTAPGRPSSAAIVLVALLTGAGFLLYGFSQRRHRASTTAPAPSCPSSRRSTSSTGSWPASSSCCWSSTALRMWWFTIGQRPAHPRCRSAPTSRRSTCCRSTSSPRSATRECEQQAALGRPPRPHAELPDDAGPDHVLPASTCRRGRRSTGASTPSATSRRSGLLATTI